MISDTHGDAVDLQESLSQIWAESLDIPVEDVDVAASYFDVGGDSLGAVELVAKIEEEFGVPLDMGEFFVDPRLGTLVDMVTRAGGENK